jgi:general secretion pathway protein H
VIRPAPKERPLAASGMTLIEIMIVLAIVGLLMGGAIAGFRSLVKSELRGSAGRLAAAIRYTYDRSITTGAYYRMHFDLDQQTYKVERSENRVLLSREKEKVGKGGKGLDQDQEAAEREKERNQRFGSSQGQGLPPELLPPPSPMRPKFEQFKDTTLPQVHLKKVRVLDIYTPRQSEPYVAGHAYLHFFPDGHTERAVIHLGTDRNDSDQYSLIVHALTGRVEIKSERVEPQRDFDAVDDAGNVKVER